MSNEGARAAVRDDWMRGGVRIAIKPDRDHVLKWESVLVAPLMEGDGALGPTDEWLDLPLDAARALYEALGDHFGHAGHDARALRTDYESERRRVDQFINYLTTEGVSS